MDYRTLGRTALRVSPIALGTMNFGPVTPEDEARAILSAAYEAGVNLIDTANVYGADANRVIGNVAEKKGLTEEIIGRWLTEDAQVRDDVVLVTKAYGRTGHGANDMYLSAKHLRHACEASLRRLGTDYIDVFMLHHVDRQAPWEEIWEAIEGLRQAGKILYAGTSNFAGWHLVQGQELAMRRGLLGLVAEESIYNLMERTVELDLLPACREYGIGILPYSPLNSGLLAGVLAKSQTAQRTASSRASHGLNRHHEALRRYEDFCADLGERPAVVGQAWLLHQQGVTAPIVGARTAEHLADGLAATRLTLTDESLRTLDDIFPGPGPAPEAYAW